MNVLSQEKSEPQWKQHNTQTHIKKQNKWDAYTTNTNKIIIT
jgi:hypothetical protein